MYSGITCLDLLGPQESLGPSEESENQILIKVYDLFNGV